MRVTLQPSGGRSSKLMNGSTSQLKPSPDSVQNNGTHHPSHFKGRKRDRGDHCFEPAKRERSSKADDIDSSKFRTECFLKSEIVKITDRGKLLDTEGVEKIVQLMLPEKNEMKIELACRTLLVSVIAATDHFGCLIRFVELRGLSILDEWIQEVHKGKVDDASSPKDSDKSIDEFLLILLRALDKLPVNLNALQTCNIGKSVNNLRTHKNLDIHRKARSLVDTWKKRVEAEMNSHDVRTRHAKVSHGGNKNLTGTSEATIKSSVSQVSLSRSTSVNPVKMDIVKSALNGNNLKDIQPMIGGFDPDQTVLMGEKSCDSGQSHNSQSCSSDHVKSAGFQGKDDMISTTSGSRDVNKMAASASEHRKSVNGRNHALEKSSPSGLTGENTNYMPFTRENNHKLIVKIQNRDRSPLNCASGGSFEDPSVMNSRASSPVFSEKPELSDHKEKSDSYAVNIASDVKTESWKSNDFKDILSVSDKEDRSIDSVSDDDDDMKMELPKASPPSSGNEPDSGNFHDAPLNSMNVLIESCIKSSEANVSTSVGDDIGMNLLASVAAGEMLKSEFVVDSKISHDDNVKEKLSGTVDTDCELDQLKNGNAGDIKKQFIAPDTSWSKESSQLKISKSRDKVDNCFSNGDCKKLAKESTAIDTDVESKKDSLPSMEKSERVEENIGNEEIFQCKFGGSASVKEQLIMYREPELSCTEADETEECESTTADVSSFSAAGGVDMDKRLEFDLNKGLNVDSGNEYSSAIHLITPLPLPISSTSNASITIAAAAKGPFVLPGDFLRSKGELGWKGSAATSAFRKVPDIPLCSTSGRRGDFHLDIDLNVPDERIYDDMACRNSTEVTGSNDRYLRSFRELDLDLNRVDETTEILPCSNNSNTTIHGSFDLNRGPSLDTSCVDPSLFFQHSSCSRMNNNAVVGSFSSPFPQESSFATGMPPLILGRAPFGHDAYVRASGPSHYMTYPFWTSFPPPTPFSFGSTTCMDPLSAAAKLRFPAVHPQFPRPYAFSMPDVSNMCWGRQGFDLNTGPTIPDTDGRDEIFSLSSRRQSVSDSQGLDTERFSYKQSPWQ